MDTSIPSTPRSSAHWASHGPRAGASEGSSASPTPTTASRRAGRAAPRHHALRARGLARQRLRRCRGVGRRGPERRRRAPDRFDRTASSAPRSGAPAPSRSRASASQATVCCNRLRPARTEDYRSARRATSRRPCVTSSSTSSSRGARCWPSRRTTICRRTPSRIDQFTEPLAVAIASSARRHQRRQSRPTHGISCGSRCARLAAATPR
jgi:hypothetical protein